MSDDRNQQNGPDAQNRKLRWPTGWLPLIGLVAGALAGLLIGLVPVGIALGLAVTVGVDSLFNEYTNGDPERIRQLLKGKKSE